MNVIFDRIIRTRIIARIKDVNFAMLIAEQFDVGVFKFILTSRAKGINETIRAPDETMRIARPLWTVAVTAHALDVGTREGWFEIVKIPHE